MVDNSSKQERTVSGKATGFSLTEDGEGDQVRSQTTHKVIVGSVGSVDRVSGVDSIDRTDEDLAMVSRLRVEDVSDIDRRTISVGSVRISFISALVGVDDPSFVTSCITITREKIRGRKHSSLSLS